MVGSDWIEFEKALHIGNRLMKNPKRKVLGLYIICAVNFGLRIGDLLKLKYSDLQGERLKLEEEKTGKKVDRKINHYVKDALANFQQEMKEPDQFIFVSQKGTVYSRQAINRFLNDQWGISSHGLRKSFGRYVYESNGSCEDILIKLGEIFNHSSLAITKRYLGIRQKEIDDIFDAM
ncbi:tyrosine-type recombinase/integrase [Zobellia sp. 1_MG-2023]|uniref:tyrosine-type recombinase/integrase n=1 Tax=Zobellia sp. 1_MG-2023 TaxID=3062626 RepID=UPI0026E26616|nr:tyrosine-type recombinase/integrase [Zobellia sp. 1_MG-2023]MDO6819071.1 tyrosine-type recombinase/integrase [Zobellia sp. 1_MG-2023]